MAKSCSPVKFAGARAQRDSSGLRRIGHLNHQIEHNGRDVRTSQLKIVSACGNNTAVTSCASARSVGFTAGFLLDICLWTVVCAVSSAAYSQSLDQAIGLELGNRSDFRYCSRLLDRDPNNISFLTGQLRTMCTSPNTIPAGVPPSTSTGGGTTTPTLLPSIEQDRLRQANRGMPKKTEKQRAASSDLVSGRSSWFVSTESDSTDKDTTPLGDGYHSQITRILAGAAFEGVPQWNGSIALAASQQDVDFDTRTRVDARSIGLMGHLGFTPAERGYFQVYAGYNQHSHDRDRNATYSETSRITGRVSLRSAPGNQRAQYDAHEYVAGIYVAHALRAGSGMVIPSMQLDWRQLSFPEYSETGPTGIELTFYGHSLASFQSRIEVMASIESRLASWILAPHVSVAWKHEFENDQRDLEVSFAGDLRRKRFTYQTDKLDGDWGEFAVGLSARFSTDLEVFGNYRILFGSQDLRSKLIAIGLRMPF
jgi:outer membrane autotransporter protein